MTTQTKWQGEGIPFESVQDALVRARLDDLQARLHEEDASAPATSDAGGRVAKAESAHRTGLRVRLGHRLVALGAALAGEDERAHAHHPA